MVKEFQFRFEELCITAADLFPLMGFENGDIPDPFPALIDQAIKEAPSYCNIRGGYKIFEEVEVDTKNETIQIENQSFSPSKVVTTQLKDSSNAALFICTAGHKISDHSIQTSNSGDPLSGYIFDVIGSVTVEKAMDRIQQSLLDEVQAHSLNISDRYSPGYCEWSVAEQQYLFDLMPKAFCDVSLSDSCLMNPIKSVSGIIGIGEHLQQKGYQCHWCTDKNCLYGKIKRKASK